MCGFDAGRLTRKSIVELPISMDDVESKYGATMAFSCTLVETASLTWVFGSTTSGASVNLCFI